MIRWQNLLWLVTALVISQQIMAADAVVSADPESEWENPPAEEPYLSEEEAAEAMEAEIQAGPDESVVVEPTRVQERDQVVSSSPSPSSTPAQGASSKKLQPHPWAKKGLLKIEKDGTYVYRTKEASKDEMMSFRIASMSPPQIESADGSSNFETMYGSSDVLGLLIDYEWQPLQAFGKLGVQVGGGFTYSQGNGRFLKDGSEAKEKYTLFMFPLNAGVIYRLEYMNRQWLAPYVAGGLSYIGLLEMRDDNDSPKMVGTAGAYGSAGIMANITALDKQLAFNLSSEYGIATMWFVFEYRRQQALSEDIDVSSNIFSAGIAVDY